MALYVFMVHYKQRRGLGPQWDDRVSEIALDDIPDEMPYYEVKDMAISQFKSNRSAGCLSEREYIIKEIEQV